MPRQIITRETNPMDTLLEGAQGFSSIMRSKAQTDLAKVQADVEKERLATLKSEIVEKFRRETKQYYNAVQEAKRMGLITANENVILRHKLNMSEQAQLAKKQAETIKAIKEEIAQQATNQVILSMKFLEEATSERAVNLFAGNMQRQEMFLDTGGFEDTLSYRIYKANFRNPKMPKIKDLNKYFTDLIPMAQELKLMAEEGRLKYRPERTGIAMRRQLLGQDVKNFDPKVEEARKAYFSAWDKMMADKGIDYVSGNGRRLAVAELMNYGMTENGRVPKEYVVTETMGWIEQLKAEKLKQIGVKPEHMEPTVKLDREDIGAAFSLPVTETVKRANSMLDTHGEEALGSVKKLIEIAELKPKAKAPTIGGFLPGGVSGVIGTDLERLKKRAQKMQDRIDRKFTIVKSKGVYSITQPNGQEVEIAENKYQDYIRIVKNTMPDETAFINKLEGKDAPIPKAAKVPEKKGKLQKGLLDILSSLKEDKAPPMSKMKKVVEIIEQVPVSEKPSEKKTELSRLKDGLKDVMELYENKKKPTKKDKKFLGARLKDFLSDIKEDPDFKRVKARFDQIDFEKNLMPKFRIKKAGQYYSIKEPGGATIRVHKSQLKDYAKTMKRKYPKEEDFLQQINTIAGV